MMSKRNNLINLKQTNLVQFKFGSFIFSKNEPKMNRTILMNSSKLSLMNAKLQIEMELALTFITGG